jgi:hypothetical protein
MVLPYWKTARCFHLEIQASDCRASSFPDKGRTRWP